MTPMVNTIKDWTVNFWNSLRTFLAPPEAYSWQAALWLSLLAWLLSRVTQAPEEVLAPISARSIMLSFGWFFLVVATGWFTQEYPPKLFGINLGPWITGALICLWWFGSGDDPNFQAALLSWPLISTAIVFFNETFEVESGFRMPRRLQTRQYLLVILVSNLLLTSWIFFGFRIQDWMVQYPGLRGERYSRSLFVTDHQAREQDFSRGTTIVQTMRNRLAQNVVGITKPEVERWLFDNKENPRLFSDAVMNQLAKENDDNRLDQQFWQLETLVGEPEYQVLLRALWLGPRPLDRGHSVELTCQISIGTSNRSELVCDDEAKVFEPPSISQSSREPEAEPLRERMSKI